MNSTTRRFTPVKKTEPPMSKLDTLYKQLSNKRISQLERNNIFGKIQKLEKSTSAIESMGVCIVGGTSSSLNTASVENIQKQKQLKIQKRMAEKQEILILQQKQKEEEEKKLLKMKENEELIMKNNAFCIHLRQIAIDIADEWGGDDEV